MALSPEQIELRRNRIPASLVSAVVGCHPYVSPIDAWLEITGQAEPFAGNRRTRWGDWIEPLVRRDYEERHGVTVEVHGTLAHPAHDWWIYTADGFVFPPGARHAERGLEIKVHNTAWVKYGGLEYGPEGTDEVPTHELMQCQWGIGGSELDAWDLVAFIDGAPTEYTILRDDELIGMLREDAERFLVDHVRAGVPPPPDGSPAWDRWLARKWRRSSGELERVDHDAAALALVAAVRDARARLADAARECEAAVQAVKDRIGEGVGLSWREPGRLKRDAVRWKRSRDGSKEDWRATARDLQMAAALVHDARASHLDRAAASLRGTGDEDAADAVIAAATALVAIASARPTALVVPGARPFTVPRHWARDPRRDDREDDNATQEQTAWSTDPTTST